MALAEARALAGDHAAALRLLPRFVDLYRGPLTFLNQRIHRLEFK
jgi:hypothetical protein